MTDKSAIIYQTDTLKGEFVKKFCFCYNYPDFTLYLDICGLRFWFTKNPRRHRCYMAPL